MVWPIALHDACGLLKVREHKLRYLIRAKKVDPKPMLGRRAWSREDVLTAAKILECDTPALREAVSA